jgi:hypothetical protein
VAQFEAFGLHCGGDGAKAQAVLLHGLHFGDGSLLLGILDTTSAPLRLPAASYSVSSRKGGAAEEPIAGFLIDL